MSKMTCDEYDYIEIACMFNLRITLHYAEKILKGIAKDTQRSPDGQEGMLLDVNNETQWAPLASLKAMTADTHNPHFTHVEFQY